MSEEAGSRYLASYLKQNEFQFYLPDEDWCTYVLDEEALQKVIQEYYDNQQNF